MQWISYIIFRIAVVMFRVTPFWLLYRLSDGLAFLMNHVIKYRKQVILENIELTGIVDNISMTKEQLVKEIYRNLMDLSLESIKGFSMSLEQIAKRHKLNNPSLLDPLVAEHQSTLLVTGHYNNWEWGAFSPNYYIEHTVIGLYKPFTNKLIEKYIKEKRKNFGTLLYSIDHTPKSFLENVDHLSLFLMAADQSPTRPDLAYWVPFLGIPTPCIHGVEKYYQKFKLPIIYAHVKRVKRGYYEIDMQWIRRKYEDEPRGKVTYDYMQILEKCILESPQNWLWSHRRWKHRDKFNGQLDYPKS